MTGDGFGMLPCWVVQSGLLARMTGGAAKVFMVIISHRNGLSGDALLGRETLAREAGVASSSIPAMVNQLMGLAFQGRPVLSVKRGGGRGLANCYHVCIKGSAGNTVSDGQTVAPESGNCSATSTKRCSGRYPYIRNKKEQTAAAAEGLSRGPGRRSRHMRRPSGTDEVVLGEVDAERFPTESEEDAAEREARFRRLPENMQARYVAAAREANHFLSDPERINRMAAWHADRDGSLPAIIDPGSGGQEVVQEKQDKVPLAE